MKSIAPSGYRRPSARQVHRTATVMRHRKHKSALPKIPMSHPRPLNSCGKSSGRGSGESSWAPRGGRRHDDRHQRDRACRRGCSSRERLKGAGRIHRAVPRGDGRIHPGSKPGPAEAAPRETIATPDAQPARRQLESQPKTSPPPGTWRWRAMFRSHDPAHHWGLPTSGRDDRGAPRPTLPPRPRSMSSDDDVATKFPAGHDAGHPVPRAGLAPAPDGGQLCGLAGSPRL